jgi:uncharacterized membrane protein
MSLPDLTIPLELPIDVPVLLHPTVVHCAIAIPVVIILLEFINLFFRKRALSVFSLFLILIVATVMAGTYFTGVTDGKETMSLLSEVGKAELKEHKLLGIYLVYGSLALIVLKLLFMALSGIISRLFFVLILIGFTAVTLKQGHEGGNLVYKYGANNQAIASIVKDKNNLKDELNKLKENCNKNSVENTSTKVQEIKQTNVEESKSQETKQEEEVKEEQVENTDGTTEVNSSQTDSNSSK